MAQLAQIALLTERRRRLVAESDQLRQQLDAELAGVRAAGAWVDRGFALMRSVGRVWPLVAGVAGFVVARKNKSRLGQLGRLWSYWRLARKAGAIWSRWTSEPASDG
jgi:hypothetical protein